MKIFHSPWWSPLAGPLHCHRGIWAVPEAALLIHSQLTRYQCWMCNPWLRILARERGNTANRCMTHWAPHELTVLRCGDHTIEGYKNTHVTMIQWAAYECVQLQSFHINNNNKKKSSIKINFGIRPWFSESKSNFKIPTAGHKCTQVWHTGQNFVTRQIVVYARIHFKQNRRMN